MTNVDFTSPFDHCKKKHMRSYGKNFTLKYLSKPFQNKKGIESLSETAYGEGWRKGDVPPPMENWGISPPLEN